MYIHLKFTAGNNCFHRNLSSFGEPSTEMEVVTGSPKTNKETSNYQVGYTFGMAPPPWIPVSTRIIIYMFRIRGLLLINLHGLHCYREGGHIQVRPVETLNHRRSRSHSVTDHHFTRPDDKIQQTTKLDVPARKCWDQRLRSVGYTPN